MVLFSAWEDFFHLDPPKNIELQSETENKVLFEDEHDDDDDDHLIAGGFVENSDAIYFNCLSSRDVRSRSSLVTSPSQLSDASGEGVGLVGAEEDAGAVDAAELLDDAAVVVG